MRSLIAALVVMLIACSASTALAQGRFARGLRPAMEPPAGPGTAAGWRRSPRVVPVPPPGILWAGPGRVAFVPAYPRGPMVGLGVGAPSLLPAPPVRPAYSPNLSLASPWIPGPRSATSAAPRAATAGSTAGLSAAARGGTLAPQARSSSQSASPPPMAGPVITASGSGSINPAVRRAAAPPAVGGSVSRLPPAGQPGQPTPAALPNASPSRLDRPPAADLPSILEREELPPPKPAEPTAATRKF